MNIDKLCERCGKLMVQVQHNRKRCPECAYIVHREQIKQRYIARKDTMTQCRGKQVKRTTISDINRIAAESGMSYGKYVAAVMSNESSIPTYGSDRDARE